MIVWVISSWIWGIRTSRSVFKALVYGKDHKLPRAGEVTSIKHQSEILEDANILPFVIPKNFLYATS
jgi:hypothetical protein